MSIRDNVHQVQDRIYPRHVLVSVFDKRDLYVLVAGILKVNPEAVFYSTGGTGAKIREILGEQAAKNYLSVEEFTGAPEMEGGLVKTLHPKIHAGLLGERGNPEHKRYLQEEMGKFGKGPGVHFDVFVGNLYPFEAVAYAEGATPEKARGNIDIGGPGMTMAAAKNWPSVAVLTNPEQYEGFVSMLAEEDGTTLEWRFKLAQAALLAVGQYRMTIGTYFSQLDFEKDVWSTLNIQSEEVTITLGPRKKLAYGENRSQSPAYLRPVVGNDDPLAMHRFEVVSGEPSYITMADGNQIVGVLCLLAEAFRGWKDGQVPYIVIAGKHGNPCGAAVDWNSPSAAIRKALMGDALAVMGGEVVTNFQIGKGLADELLAPQPENDQHCPADIGRANWGLDIIFAPSFSEMAVELLGKREKRRLLANPELMNPRLAPESVERRPVRGGFLEQQASRFLLTEDAIINREELALSVDVDTLLIAWAVCWRASSNTVALAKDQMLIGLGCGQQDRIACVRLCLDRANRAGHDPQGSWFASDAFFPYAEGQLLDAENLSLDFEDKLYALKGEAEDIEAENPNPTPRELLVSWQKVIRAMEKLDKREGPELLVDAGCIGGVVPYDGKNREAVAKLFADAKLSVAFVAPENRGFSKHA